MSTTWEDDIRISYEGTIAPLPFGDTHYKVFGTVGPMVVFIHGFGLHSAIFYPIAEELSCATTAPYRTLIYDNYGRGKSATPNVNQTPDLFDHQLWALLAHLGVPSEEKVTLVGFSMGAAIAIIAAGRHPERIRSLVAIGPPGLKPTPLDFSARVMMTPFLGAPLFWLLGPMAMRQRLESGQSLQGDFHDSAAHPVVCRKYQEMIRESQKSANFVWSVRNTLMHFPLQDMAPHVETLAKVMSDAAFPVTVILARHDGTCPPAPELWAKLAPKAMLKWTETGHMSLWEDYPETKRLVVESL